MPPYRQEQQKRRDAEAYRREEGIPWAVLVDDLPGTVHQAYGTLADPTYLIDRDGRVAFYQMVTGPPALHEAIAALLAQGGRGVALGGWDRFPHLGPTLTAGWPAVRRGLPQSFADLMRAAPGSPVLLWLGHHLRPVLAPLTLRAEPWPPSVKAAALLGVATAAALGLAWLLVVRSGGPGRGRRHG